jgi:drug/metabolite transporter (DMT)-like permease
MTVTPVGADRPRLGLARPRLSSRGVAVASLLFASVAFGASTVASKAALDSIPPLTLAFERFGLALAVLLLLCRRAGVRPAFSRPAALFGITGIALPFVCQNAGLQYATAVDTTLVIEGGLPIVTALLGAAFLGERIAGRRLAGLVLAVGGVGIVMLLGASGRGDFSLLGSLLAFAAAASFAAYTVIGRRLFSGRFSLAVLTGGVAIGVLLLAPCAAVEIAVAGPGTLTPGDGLLLLYLGVGGSAGTQILWARGMADLDASEVAIFGTLMPVVGIASAAVCLGEAVGLAQVGGGLVVAAGLYVTARPPRSGPDIRSPERRLPWARRSVAVDRAASRPEIPVAP